MTGEPLTVARMANLRAAFTEADLPFRVDAVDWASTSESFRRVVEADYVVLQRPVPRNLDAEDGWTSINLGRTCTKIGSGATPRGGKDVYRPSGPYALIRSQNVLNDGFRHEGLAYIGEHHASELSSAEVLDGDVLLNITGDSVARACQVDPHVLPARVNQHVAIIRPDPEKLDPGLLRYLLVSPEMQTKLLSWAASGGTRNALTKGMIESLDVPSPRDIRDQRTIAHVLGTLDDKIELNRRMNATLEAMAQALFRSWFVDFDPVRAKMEGRDTGLPKEIADLFPGRLVDSELGEIPLGWSIGYLSEHFEAIKGVSYKGSGLGRGGTPLHNLNSVDKRGGYRCEGIKFYSGDYADRHVVYPGDVIVANTDLGRENLLIGYSAIVPRLFGGSGIVSHHLYRVRARPSGRLSAVFLYRLLNSPQMHDVVAGYANGTTVTMLPKDALQMPAVVEPPRTLLETFDALALDLEHRREQAVVESRTLGALRDALLPKLVSGELRVTGLEPASAHGDRPAPVGMHGA